MRKGRRRALSDSFDARNERREGEMTYFLIKFFVLGVGVELRLLVSGLQAREIRKSERKVARERAKKRRGSHLLVDLNIHHRRASDLHLGARLVGIDDVSRLRDQSKGVWTAEESRRRSARRVSSVASQSTSSSALKEAHLHSSRRRALSHITTTTTTTSSGSRKHPLRGQSEVFLDSVLKLVESSFERKAG